MRPAPLRSAMTISDPVSAGNLTVFLVQLPRESDDATKADRRPAARRVPHPLSTPARLARWSSQRPVSPKRVRLENHSKRDLFLQAGEVLRGGGSGPGGGG